MGSHKTDREEKIVRISSAVTSYLGSTQAMALSALMIVLWAAMGPVFGFSETWQLVINTATTIITFLMVFIIQNTQNRDGKAIQTKLDAILEEICEVADSELLKIEDKPEEVIDSKHEQITKQGA